MSYKISKKLLNLFIYPLLGVWIFMFSIINANAEVCYNFDDFLSDFEKELIDETADSDNAVIVNEIKIKANTGGNYADTGEVVEGEAIINIDIESSVSDKTVEDIEITEEESKNIEVNIESYIEADKEKATVKTITDINGEIKEEEKEIKIEELKAEAKNEEINFDDAAVEEKDFTNNDKQAEYLKETEDQDGEQVKQKESAISVIFLSIISAIKDSFLKLFSFFV